jgi:hypothetical protein
MLADTNTNTFYGGSQMSKEQVTASKNEFCFRQNHRSEPAVFDVLLKQAVLKAA